MALPIHKPDVKYFYFLQNIDTCIPSCQIFIQTIFWGSKIIHVRFNSFPCASDCRDFLVMQINMYSTIFTNLPLSTLVKTNKN